MGNVTKIISTIFVVSLVSLLLYLVVPMILQHIVSTLVAIFRLFFKLG